MKNSTVIIILVLVLAALGGFIFKDRILPVVRPFSAVPTPPPAKGNEFSLAGTVVSVSIGEKRLTLGTYGVDKGEISLVSERNIAFTDETVVLKEGGGGREPQASVRDLKAGDNVSVFASASDGGRKVFATKVVILRINPGAGGR